MNEILISGQQLKPAFVASSLLPGVNLDVRDASIVAMMGPDVAARSGWLRLLAGIESPQSGRLQVLGQDVSQMDHKAWQSMRIHLAYLNEQSALLSVLPVIENILLPSIYHRLGPRNELMSQARQLMQDMGVEDNDDLSALPAYVNACTYCQAMLVRVLLMKPRILIMDNVFKKLNARDADRLMAFVMRYVKEQGIALLFHTENLELMLDHADRILFVTQRFVLQYKDRHDIRISDDEDVIQYLQEHYIN